SVHNVRIERLWRDVRKDTLEFFRQLFLYLEAQGLLDPDSKIHLIALYIIYQPRIQQSLDRTISSWNNHAIRTEGNQSPTAIYELSKEHAINCGYWNTKSMGDSIIDDFYGVDDEAIRTHTEQEDGEDPQAPRSDNFQDLKEEQDAGIVVMDDEEINEGRKILSSLNVAEEDGAWGTRLYCEAVLILTSYYTSQSSNNNPS
ncbi:hypothetical protein CVT24_007175, partial [Panaeolus cyanescens]